MMGFMLFLVVVCIAWFAWSCVNNFRKRGKVTIPQPSEVTTQFSSASVVETIEQQPRFTTPVRNSHWFRHTFERNRKKKVKS